ncbi:unannotated protein [freshwater metagenome]|uniref:Unannotated protein n=1 Tax=freshwater metagenome TaxID=449393 RepID=A0A6J6SMF4_9ZZZZ
MPTSRGRTTVLESITVKKLFSSNQPIALPGDLIFPTWPRGGPQVSRSKTAAESAGISLSALKSIFFEDWGPRPAGSSPIKWRRFPGNLNFVPSLYTSAAAQSLTNSSPASGVETERSSAFENGSVSTHAEVRISN